MQLLRSNAVVWHQHSCAALASPGLQRTQAVDDARNVLVCQTDVTYMMSACCQSVPAGDLASSDASTRTLWLMVKDNRKLLSPSKDALGVEGVKLIEPLLALVDAHEDREAAEEEEQDEQEVRGSSGSSM